MVQTGNATRGAERAAASHRQRSRLALPPRQSSAALRSAACRSHWIEFVVICETSQGPAGRASACGHQQPGRAAGGQAALGGGRERHRSGRGVCLHDTAVARSGSGQEGGRAGRTAERADLLSAPLASGLVLLPQSRCRLRSAVEVGNCLKAATRPHKRRGAGICHAERWGALLCRSGLLPDVAPICRSPWQAVSSASLEGSVGSALLTCRARKRRQGRHDRAVEIQARARAIAAQLPSLPPSPPCRRRLQTVCAGCAPASHRDGLERIEVDGNANLAALKLAIQEKLGVPVAEQQLSKNPALVRRTEGTGPRAVGWAVAAASCPLPSTGCWKSCCCTYPTRAAQTTCCL